MGASNKPYPELPMGAASETSTPDYERSDANARWMLPQIIGIVVLIAVTQGLLWMLLQSFRSSATRHDPLPSPVAQQHRPPPPRLQPAPQQDYQGYLSSHDRRLNTYGWVDKRRQTVRIPVSKAMSLILERGLPEAKRDGGKKREPSS